ncbi:hypothetical protein Tco_0957735 [Tanacetum coccineum]
MDENVVYAGLDDVVGDDGQEHVDFFRPTAAGVYILLDYSYPVVWDMSFQVVAAMFDKLVDDVMMDVQQDAQNEEGAESRSQAHPSTPPEVVPSDIKMDQQDSKTKDLPPGWDSKCQPGSNPTTP